MDLSLLAAVVTPAPAEPPAATTPHARATSALARLSPPHARAVAPLANLPPPHAQAAASWSI
jgi:hypothetical protein